MKKIILITSAFLLMAGSAFAEVVFDSEGGYGTGVLTGFKASRQVNVACQANSATYAATADHLSGTRVYGTSAGDPLLYFLDKTAAEIGTNVAAGKLNNSDSTDFATWASL